MCAIVDANVVHEVFGSNLPVSGRCNSSIGLKKVVNGLVVGGKQLEELEQGSEGFREWASEAADAGKMRVVNKNEIDARTREIENEGEYKSDDPHILALAQVSGARLLYSNDGDLQEDFGNKSLIDQPRGKVYSTRENKDFHLFTGGFSPTGICVAPKNDHTNRVDTQVRPYDIKQATRDSLPAPTPPALK